jgi:hypothetical protein
LYIVLSCFIFIFKLLCDLRLLIQGFLRVHHPVLRTYLKTTNTITAHNRYAVSTSAYSFGIVKWSNTELELIRIVHVSMTWRYMHQPQNVLVCKQNIAEWASRMSDISAFTRYTYITQHTHNIVIVLVIHTWWLPRETETYSVINIINWLLVFTWSQLIYYTIIHLYLQLKCQTWE